MSESEYRVFRSRVFEEKTWIEIAAELDLTIDQVRYR
jgi:hypothetical protein